MIFARASSKEDCLFFEIDSQASAQTFFSSEVSCSGSRQAMSAKVCPAGLLQKRFYFCPGADEKGLCYFFLMQDDRRLNDARIFSFGEKNALRTARRFLAEIIPWRRVSCLSNT